VNKTTKILYVNSSIVKTISNFLLKNGLEIKTLEEILHCSIKDLEAHDFRLPITNYQSLWKFALDYSHNPALAIKLAQKSYNDEMGLVAHIFFNSPTMQSGLKHYQRYYSLVNEAMHIEIKTDARFAYINYICTYDEAYCSADMEHTLALSIVRVKQNISNLLALEAVHFQHKKPVDLNPYTELFNCKIYFEKDCCALIMKKEYLDYKLPRRSSYLYKLLTRHIESLLKKLRRNSDFSTKVKNIINRQLSKDCLDAEHIAKKLFMSRNTLYRKLKQEGSSFHDLVDQVREKKAYYYLDQNKHSLSEIAFLLGFSELSAFSRAFKRWTGKSPGNFLKSKSN